MRFKSLFDFTIRLTWSDDGVDTVEGGKVKVREVGRME